MRWCVARPWWACVPVAVLFLLIGQGRVDAAPQDPPPSTIVCGSKPGERQQCDANTEGGVTVVRALGDVACELGRTWGYDQRGVWVADGCSAEFAVKAARTTFGTYTPLQGFKVADTDRGDMNLRLFTYVRYLNQQGVDPTYTNAFGRTTDVQQRHDIQLNKVQVYFSGWLLDRRFRYLAYVWTANVSQGQNSQVVVAGNLRYNVSDRLSVAAGIGGLPGVRSTEGNFPFWLMVDSRQIADEFFRPSYTTGFWVEGRLLKGLTYAAMLGNNLSQFSIDAGQLDPGLDTVSGALVWMPTTGEFGRGFGDYDRHDRVATRVAIHGTRSNETRQGQPDTDAFDNVQLRVSDGSVIFTPGLFADDVQIESATYALFAIDAGIKYRGVSFDVEHYRRRIDSFGTRGAGLLPFKELNDSGYQVQASAMVMPGVMQVYGGGSRVSGQYGKPSDVRVGLSYFPARNEVIRWNFEYAQFNRSPVGALALPFSVGVNGPVFQTNLMVWF